TGSTASCPSSPPRRTGFMSRWPPRRPTTPRFWRSTPPCGPSWTNVRASSWNGFRSPRSSAEPCLRSGPHQARTGSGLEWRQQLAQELAEVFTLGRWQLIEQDALAVKQVGHGGIDNRTARGGQPHLHAAPVAGVGAPADQAAGSEPVDSVGHGPAGHQRLRDELSRGELVRRALSSER